MPQDKIPTLNGSKHEHTPIEQAEQIVAGMPKRPIIQQRWPRAFYSPDGDLVGMPVPELFRTPEEYYSVLFHELTHSTGHESRLNRKGVAGLLSAFGSQSYSQEELVAEMGQRSFAGRRVLLSGQLTTLPLTLRHGLNGSRTTGVLWFTHPEFRGLKGVRK